MKHKLIFIGLLFPTFVFAQNACTSNPNAPITPAVKACIAQELAAEFGGPPKVGGVVNTNNSYNNANTIIAGTQGAQAASLNAKIATEGVNTGVNATLAGIHVAANKVGGFYGGYQNYMRRLNSPAGMYGQASGPGSQWQLFGDNYAGSELYGFQSVGGGNILSDIGSALPW